MRTVRTAVTLRNARRRLAERPRLGDTLLGVGLTAFDVTAILFREPSPSAAGVVLWGAQSLPLVWRRGRPLVVLATMTAAFVAFETTRVVPHLTPGPYFLALAVYSAARHAPYPSSLGGATLSGIVAVATTLLTRDDAAPRLWALEPVNATTFVVFFAVAWLVGAGRRRIDGDAARLKDLNERLRAEQEKNAERAVLTERARIARDLHDVVAHHVCAIAVQARSTEEVLQDDPTLGRQGVALIADTADVALEEMRRILGLLAAREEGPRPGPSLRALDELVHILEAAGCRVTLALDEATGDVPEATRLSAYRIAQECAMNVVKHAAPTEVRIGVRVDAGALSVQVENGPPPADHRSVPGSGLGLIGIRERVAAFDGDLEAGPRPDGGWRVHATLPPGGRR
ncbi:sensor histidine kinase [Actinomadura spongiicola]|uniref:histidine kinase n=1 Tax=Actinomadura spongiicola TaxID=2303421 RepID=A0A372GE60_9ACTN|nr:histidine kinase [Actinomadura spongiicola]RFS83482.1 sensor histidine kinase [Actinomadura spongiicola]